MSWITSSEGGRLFRPGDAPPLRGTLLPFSDRKIVLQTKGSIEFYSTYPGMYVPQPIGIRAALRTRSARDTGSEILALTKMNWNQIPAPGDEAAQRHDADPPRRAGRMAARPRRRPEGARRMNNAPDSAVIAEYLRLRHHRLRLVARSPGRPGRCGWWCVPPRTGPWRGMSDAGAHAVSIA